MKRHIIEDTRNKLEKHSTKHTYWEESGVGLIRCKLPFGDYSLPPKVAVDTKQDIHEIGLNMCGSMAEKKRFREECKLAQSAGCRLVFLIEDKHYKEIPDLYGQKIYLHNKQIIPGDQLATAMYVMQERYGVRFEFCDPEDAGRRVVEILEEQYEEEKRIQEARTKLP